MKTSWQFIEDKLGRWKGLNDGAVEHFRKNPMASLAREIIQNSLDASSSLGPVQVTFKLIEIPKKDFPNLAELESKLVKAKDTPRNSSDTRTLKAIQAALECINQDSIKVLEISERNTKGMAGPHYDDQSPFFAYTKGSGLSAKHDGTLGSFGIGKNAPVANSLMRTIFVSTNYIEGEKQHFLCQGMAFWVTHTEDGQKRFEGNGYWGTGTGEALTTSELAPSWLQRQEVGTSIFVCAPNLPKSGWSDLLTGSVLTSFFAAIHDGRLEVTAGKHQINKQTVATLFQNQSIKKAFSDDDDLLEKFNSSQGFYRCMLEPTHIENTQVQDPLGNFEVRILLEEDSSKEVGFVRNGMYISSNCIPNLKRFKNTIDFTAVVICTNESGNHVLREMEPPEHNAFEGNRYSPESGSRLLNILGKKIREQLAKHIMPDYGEVSSVSFLASILGVEREKGERDANSATDFNPEGKVVQRLKAVSIPIPKMKSTQQVMMGNDGLSDDALEGENTNESSGGAGKLGSDNVADGRDAGDGGDGKNEKSIEVNISNMRYTNQADDLVNFYLSIGHVGEVLIKFFISGADSDETMAVYSTNIGRPYAGGVLLTSEGPKNRIQLQVKLTETTKSALLARAYAI
jgi:hypothetical protein